MKHAVLGLMIVLMGCNSRIDWGALTPASVTDVRIPDAVRADQTLDIRMTAVLPDSCHGFARFDIKRSADRLELQARQRTVVPANGGCGAAIVQVPVVYADRPDVQRNTPFTVVIKNVVDSGFRPEPDLTKTVTIQAP